MGVNSNDMCRDILQNSASAQAEFCHDFGICQAWLVMLTVSATVTDILY